MRVDLVAIDLVRAKSCQERQRETILFNVLKLDPSSIMVVTV